VGFYQMTKLAIIPCTVTLQSLFYGKRFGFMVKVALGVLLGVTPLPKPFTAHIVPHVP
jgi:hypothetical protein